MTGRSLGVGSKPLFNNDFNLAPRLQPVAGIEPVQSAETLDGTIGNHHFAGQFLHRIARRHRDDLQAKRLGILDFREAHAAEGADRFAENPVGFRCAMFDGEYEPVDVAAKPDRVEAEIPLVALGGRGRGRADGHRNR